MVKEAYPDESALDPKSPKHDPKATSDKPRWFMVDVRLVRSTPMQSHSHAVCMPRCTIRDYPLDMLTLGSESSGNIFPYAASVP